MTFHNLKNLSETTTYKSQAFEVERFKVLYKRETLSNQRLKLIFIKVLYKVKNLEGKKTLPKMNFFPLRQL